MSFTLVALNSEPGLGRARAPTVVQDVDPAVKISVDFVFSSPVKPPVTKNV